MKKKPQCNAICKFAFGFQDNNLIDCNDFIASFFFLFCFLFMFLSALFIFYVFFLFLFKIIIIMTTMIVHRRIYNNILCYSWTIDKIAVNEASRQWKKIWNKMKWYRKEFYLLRHWVNQIAIWWCSVERWKLNLFFSCW